MIYELRTTIFAENHDAFDDVLDKLNDLKPNLKVLHPGADNQECSVIEVIECNHDETPPQPCHDISHWDNCPLEPPPIDLP